ncbi:MAG: ATP-binding cassette domain-containing protein [Alphaproteobacteria bacterium]|nr:ATP-binding cassette domain-containing protein [Alphaproteobacteria bacterium]
MSKDSIKPPHRSKTLAVSTRTFSVYIKPFLGLILLGILANLIIAGAAGALPWFIQQAVDSVFVNGDRSMLVIIPLGVVIMSVVRGGATYLSNVILNYVGQKITARLQLEIYENIIKADLETLGDSHTGNYIAIFLNDAKLMANTLNQTLINLFRHFFTLIVLTGMMFSLNWKLASIYVIIVMPAGILSMRRLGKVTRKASHQGLTETGLLSRLISETIKGIRVVKAYAGEKLEAKNADRVINRVLEFTMRSVRAKSASSPIVESLAGIAVAGIIFWGGSQSFEGNLTAGEFMGFISALLLAYQPLRSVANLPVVLQEGVAAGLRVFDIIDKPIEIKNKPEATELKISRGGIGFKNVSFAYGNRDVAALDGISIDINPGETVALVGPSGAGKSTLLNLVLRFYDPVSGSIEIDGQDIQNVTIESLRASTALVTQEPFLFDDTIAANIAYGQNNASQKDIEKAAKSAAAHHFISVLPEGYDTRCGEGGMQLSGGQRQRIAIARAMVKDTPILLLDEATSALDNKAEKEVQKALTYLMQDRTSLVVAHRLSTIINADKIYVINQGKVVQSGSHEELSKAKGLYAELYKAQFED